MMARALTARDCVHLRHAFESLDDGKRGTVTFDALQDAFCATFELSREVVGSMGLDEELPATAGEHEDISYDEFLAAAISAAISSG